MLGLSKISTVIADAIGRSLKYYEWRELPTTAATQWSQEISFNTYKPFKNVTYYILLSQSCKTK